MTAAVVVGGVVSLTVTIKLVAAWLAWASVALKRTVADPKGKTLPEAGVAVTVTAVLGSPERPLPPEAARAKFIDCWDSVPGLPPDQGTALWDAVFALETLGDVRPLAARTSI